MDGTNNHLTTRARLEVAVQRVADLVRAVRNVNQPVADGRWTIRDVAAHLITGIGLYTELARGGSSPFHSLLPADCTAVSEQLMADISEGNAARLATLLGDSVERFLDETCDKPGQATVSYHGGATYDLLGLTGTLLGEALLHGFDIAARVHRPWRIDPGDAQLVLAAYAPMYHLIVNPDRVRGLNVAVAIDLHGGSPVVGQFRDGEFAFQAPSGILVDATIVAEPVAFLLVGSGRLDLSVAVALGAIEVSGPHPEVAMAFPSYFWP